MKCERCHRERNGVSRYGFYYGRKSSSRYLDASGIGVRRIEVTGYQIAGSDGAWICDGCVGRSFWLRILLFVLTAIVWISLMAVVFTRPELITPAFAPYLLAGSLLSLMLIFSMLSYLPAGRNQVGEYLAIGVKRRAWRKQGYRAFLTSNKLKRLQKNR
jgi:hypothetical protein